MKLLRDILPILAALVVLGLLVGFKTLRGIPEQEVMAYHASVRQAVQDVPMSIGNWRGEETEVPPAAATLLEPVALRCISYRNVLTGATAKLAIIHCGDARDMQGHYPPRCYPGSGWRLGEVTPITHQLGGMSIPSTGYTFSRETIGQYRQMHITNFILLPDGRIFADMSGLEGAARSRLSRDMGAAQIQLITEFRLSPSARREVFDTLVGANIPLLRAILREDQTHATE